MPPSLAPRTPFVPVDAVGLEERAATFATRSIKRSSKVAALKLVVAMTDLTTLAGADTDGKVLALCAKAMSPDLDPETPHTAAVCVYPPFIGSAKRTLGDSGVLVAAVSTYFPSGQAAIELRVDETRRAVEAGADEIDMVISRGAFLAGDRERVFDEVSSIKAVCGGARLKVILETGELGTYDNVRLAAQIAIDAGADFIKTSTGKVQPAATLPTTLVMLETIRDHFLRTGRQVGMKPAGGIRSSKDALRYLAMVKEVLGDAWLTPHWFRFGASSLLNDVLLQLQKERDGAYQSERAIGIAGAY